ncbi:MAG: DUF1684 domain-containing protein [Anaerolineae bacterium]
MATPGDPLSLANWRRTVAELYAQIRREAAVDPAAAWRTFCATRDELFRSHSQTPLDEAQRAGFSRLSYFDYDPAWRLVGRVETAVPRETLHGELGADGALAYTRIAYIHFTVAGQPARLSLYWIEGYGGGLFLPFKDATNGQETYGGGRYLYDTIKGADLGAGSDEILLDFNFAYNPSCAYNPRWVCPLAPAENHLPIAVPAGEKNDA